MILTAGADISLKARAKINLTLRVTDRRADGYHLLDSLVVFADTGDQLHLKPDAQSRLEITGPFAASLQSDSDNLVLRAHQVLSDTLKAPLPPTVFHLEKNLPVSSGIGGGSADAAAALKGLVDLWKIDITLQELNQIALRLGADVPVCLSGTACRMTGIGEALTPIEGFPIIDAVLINPGVSVATPEVFKALSLPLDQKTEAVSPDLPTGAEILDHWIDWLNHTGNDLQQVAIELVPEIGDVIKALDQSPACKLARMSGSGATCFGLFNNAEDAKTAAAAVANDHPGWWVVATRLG